MQKICSKCDIPKDLEQFHRKKSSPDGHVSVCKLCRVEETRIYRKTNSDILILKARDYYTRNRTTVRAKAQARLKNRTPEQREHDRQYAALYAARHPEEMCRNRHRFRSRHREELRTKQRAYAHRRHLLYPELAKQQGKLHYAKYKDDPVHQEKNRKNARDYRQEHHESVKARQRAAYADNPVKYRERVKRFQHAHPGLVRIWQRLRYARLRTNGPYARIDILIIAERDHWRCHLCHKKVTYRTWSLDHLIPVSAGGPHIPENVALAHLRCNSRRGAGRIPAQLRLLG